jgi:hypothetical protein
VCFVAASSGLVLLTGFSASVMHVRCYHSRASSEVLGLPELDFSTKQ